MWIPIFPHSDFWWNPKSKHLFGKTALKTKLVWDPFGELDSNFSLLRFFGEVQNQNTFSGKRLLRKKTGLGSRSRSGFHFFPIAVFGEVQNQNTFVGKRLLRKNLFGIPFEIWIPIFPYSDFGWTPKSKHPFGTRALQKNWFGILFEIWIRIFPYSDFWRSPQSKHLFGKTALKKKLVWDPFWDLDSNFSL